MRTMIDWVTCRVPVTLPAPIAGGFTVKLDASGAIQGTFPHRLSVEGSFSSSLTIRAPSTCELEISGNVAKWLAGHNLYGTDDLLGLLWAAVERLEPHLGCSLGQAGLHGPDSLLGAILTRVDCTAMVALDAPADVLTFIRSAHLTGTLSHRGRGVMKEGTLVYGDARGRNFTRSQLVLYSKGQEITDHPLPALMMSDPEVLGWVNKCLRVEARFGRLDLQEKGLRLLSAWRGVTPYSLWRQVMDKLTFSDVIARDGYDLEKLPKKFRSTFAFWQTGADIRRLLSKPTYYRHRAAIRELTGVDISLPPARAPTAQIVPLKRVLEMRIADRPPWADRVDAQLREAGAIVLPFAA